MSVLPRNLPDRKSIAVLNCLPDGQAREGQASLTGTYPGKKILLLLLVCNNGTEKLKEPFSMIYNRLGNPSFQPCCNPTRLRTNTHRQLGQKWAGLAETDPDRGHPEDLVGLITTQDRHEGGPCLLTVLINVPGHRATRREQARYMNEKNGPMRETGAVKFRWIKGRHPLSRKKPIHRGSHLWRRGPSWIDADISEGDVREQAGGDPVEL